MFKKPFSTLLTLVIIREESAIFFWLWSLYQKITDNDKPEQADLVGPLGTMLAGLLER